MNRKKQTNRPFFYQKRFWQVFAVCVVLLGAVAFLAVLYSVGDYRDRAEKYDLARINDLEIPSIILDRNGKELGRIFVQNRSVIPIDQVPENFIQALQAGEDSRFLSHGGVDYIGTIRALKLTVQGSSQGGSTITQQLARNAYNLKEEAVKQKENTIQRKLVEMFLAMRIEQRYSKREILEFYLNRIYFGSGYYGIRSAALGYYGKEPKDLTTDECASIVTLIKNPNGRSPLNNPEANKNGRNYVLMRMEEEGFIDKAEMARLQALPLKVNPRPLKRGTSQLYELIARKVADAVGEDALVSGGFKIYTSILLEAQEAAQQVLKDSLRKAEQHPGYAHPKYGSGSKDFLQGAVLMVDHETGGVLAHVGGRDYSEVQYDFIELGKKPPGTTFLPFVYAAGFEHGLSPATIVEDEQMDNRSVMIGGLEGVPGEWGMESRNPVYEGEITARTALEQSKIAASVRFSEKAGLNNVIGTAVDVGLSYRDVEVLPRVVVGFEPVSLKNLVRAYSVFPRAGKLDTEEFHYIEKVVSAAGNTVYRKKVSYTRGKQVISPATAWQVHSCLAGTLYRGSAKGVLDNMLERPFQGGGKGGSTYDYSDSWFVGYNGRVTCGVWTGFLKTSGPIYPAAFSRDLAMPVWQAAMNAATSFSEGVGLKAPEGVHEVQICTKSGQRATQFCFAYSEDETTGQVVSRPCSVMEYMRKDAQKIPYCSLHSGASSEGMGPDLINSSMPVLDVFPIQPKEPVVIGEDPYHAESPAFADGLEGAGGYRRSSANIFDSIMLGDSEETIDLPKPTRLRIEVEDLDDDVLNFE